MSVKLKRKHDQEKVYRTPLLLRLWLSFIMVMGIPFFALWIRVFLSQPSLASIIPSVIGLGISGFTLWYSYQAFSVRLTISTEGGKYQGFGYQIVFRWKDVKQVQWGPYWHNSYWKLNWYLIVDKPTEVTKHKGAWLAKLIYWSPETHIPLCGFDFLTVVFPFLDLWNKPLGRDIHQYAPHLYAPYLKIKLQKSKR